MTKVTITTAPFDGIYNRWKAYAKIPYKSIKFAMYEHDPLHSPGFTSVIAYGRTKESARARCEVKVREAVERDRKEHQRDLSRIAKTSVEQVQV